MALGARHSQVLIPVLRQGVILTGIGMAFGVGGAAAGTRLLRGMLFGVTALDFTTFAGAFLLLGLVATVAVYMPARRAATIDPIAALRSE
jgi:ABC-type antimicrobial peptide transport system permease subunit